MCSSDLPMSVAGTRFEVTCVSMGNPHAVMYVSEEYFAGERDLVAERGPKVERAREFPAGAVTLVLDDSVFALYAAAAWRASPVPATLTVIYPRGARRATLTIRDLGIEATTLNRNPTTLRHVVVSGGADGAVHLWLTRDGRLLKVEIPARRVVAERAPGD